jgi:hypothetical protein
MGMKKAILQEIKEEQLRWYGHVMRMESTREKEAQQTSQHMNG